MADAREPTAETLASYVAAEPPPHLVGGIMAAVAADRRRRRRRWPAVGAAVAAAAALLLLWWVLDPKEIHGHLVADTERTVAIGTRATAVARPGAELSWHVSRDGAARVTQRAGAVRYDVRPGGAFVVDTGAGQVRVLGTNFVVEVDEMKPNVKHAVIGGAIGVAVTVSVYEGRVLFANEHGLVELSVGEQASAAADTAPARPAAPAARKPAAERPALPGQDTDRAVTRLERPEDRRRLQRAVETARLERLERALGGAAGAADMTGDSRPPVEGALDKDVIRATVGEIQPLIKECYMLALEQAPELGGRIELELIIAGEPEVGGLVEDVIITSDNAISIDPVMSECLVETVLSLEFPPPENGGQVTVRYPFEFANQPD